MQPTCLRHPLLLCFLGLWLPCTYGAYVQYKLCEAGLNGDLTPESLNARVDQSDGTTRLDLELIYVYDGLETCQAILNGPIDVLLDLDTLGSSRSYQVAPSAVNRTCTLPARYRPQTSLSQLTEVHVSIYKNIGVLYPLSTFAIDVHLRQNQSEDLACISANITPEFNEEISAALKYGPISIFLFVVLSALAAVICGFRTSVDAESREIVSISVLPGVGDCLQYLQFIFFTGSLTLPYPGFFQPVVSFLSWAALYSRKGPVNHGFSYSSSADGIYEINGTFTGSYGLEVMAQVVGAPATMDAWLNMVVLIFVIAIGTAVLIQMGSLVPLVRDSFSRADHTDDTQISQIRHHTWTVLKVIFSYFLLPIITISAYQISNSRLLPVYHLSLAATLIAAMILSFSWLAKQVPTRQLGTLILEDSKRYHKLPSDRDTNAFVLILFSLGFARGAAIGGLQVSALAQIVLLATFEIFLLASIIILRPFRVLSGFTLSTAIRAIIVLLSSAFLPILDASTSTKSLIGYIILFLHAAILIICFLLPAFHRLWQVLAKRSPGEEPEIYGLRELRRRRNPSQLSVPISQSHRQSFSSPDLHSDSSRSDSSYRCPPHEASRYYRLPRSRPSSFYLSASSKSISPASPGHAAMATRAISPISIVITSPKETAVSLLPISSTSSDSQDITALSDCSSQSKPLASRWSDYTFREADLYYGQPRWEDPEAAEEAPAVVRARPSLFSTFRTWWKTIGKKEEKGFQVVRPPRPSEQG